MMQIQGQAGCGGVGNGSVQMLPIEILESRRMLSVQVDVAQGLISVRGTDADDVIIISRDKDRPHRYLFTINGIQKYAVLKWANDIIVEGRAGNDHLEVDQHISGPAFDVILKGGAGDDLLVGGGGLNDLRGREGNDTLVGNSAHDLLI